MRCQRLDDDGKRCRRKAVYLEEYFGDKEFSHYDEVGWVEVYLCKKHTINSINRKRC